MLYLKKYGLNEYRDHVNPVNQKWRIGLKEYICLPFKDLAQRRWKSFVIHCITALMEILIYNDQIKGITQWHNTTKRTAIRYIPAMTCSIVINGKVAVIWLHSAKYFLLLSVCFLVALSKGNIHPASIINYWY